MANRKQELVENLLDYLLQNGVADLSLRPMAAAVGTSARLLIFHFGSKEKLVAEVLAEMQARLQISFARLSAVKPGARRVPLLRAFWDWALAKENYGHLRLLYQLQTLATQENAVYAGYLKGNAMNWLELIQAALPQPQRNSTLATLFCSVFDGLFIEFMSTGDRKRTTAAIDLFVDLARKHISS
ncbi:TetR/AcrR family transcriptional regulator [Pseudolysobacter antarcticus]|uniref:TetR/AcrR family transcriptional regulator n=1 Tax=Pseudolysobacter antarcticus TaxID=2511995 RepID=A0A411HL50_9GAMM|nr:TetR/AcrR family transcriptional regulator [Pseudolysobacter antarcticus]QBB71256.1 TetR/AcrR family transcriptional regulator [Pseudolysobacter antarcticus]